jgi:hypothetical protein
VIQAAQANAAGRTDTLAGGMTEVTANDMLTDVRRAIGLAGS